MRKIDLAYLAGILDGEGCVHIAKEKRKQSFVYKLRVQVSMVDKVPPMLAHNTFGGYLRLRDRNAKWKPLWEWQVKSNNAVTCLKVLLPYLRTKRVEAELALKFWSEKNHVAIRKTKEVAALEEANYTLMKSLKNKVSLR